MRKFVSLFLTLALLLTTISFEVSATEIEQSSYDSLIQKAAAAFPEYAEKIQNPKNSAYLYSRDATPRELLVSETRPISDVESITYAEYSDGLILLSGYDFTCDSTVVDSSTGSTYKKYTIDVEAACIAEGYNGYFYLDGVSYILRNGYDNFDSITAPGTERKGTNCVSASRTDYTQNESYTGYARIAYYLGFRIGPKPTQFVTSNLTIHVGEDTAIVDHLSWN